MATGITGFGNSMVDIYFYISELQLFITVGMNLVFD